MTEWLVYALYRAVAFAVPLLPRPAMVFLGRRMGWAYYFFSRRCRENGIENLRLAMPERTDHRRILRNAMRQMGVALLDSLWSAQLTPDVVGKHLSLDPVKLRWFKDMAAKGQGVVIATAHFGSWEMFNLAAPGLGFPPATFIARAVRNRLIDRHLRRQREKTGNRLVYREQALHACVGALRRGEIVCSVIDMAVPPQEGGVYTDFFKVPALTSAALPLLALRRGAPLLFAVCRPVETGQRYFIDVEEIEVRRDATDRRAELRRLAQELTHALERAVRAHPQCWIWDYRRWMWRPGEWPGAYPSYSLWGTDDL